MPVLFQWINATRTLSAFSLVLLLLLIPGWAGCSQPVLDVAGPDIDTPTAVAAKGGAEAMVPLIDMGTGTYFGFEGGLYPSNQMPRSHLREGLRRMTRVRPLDGKGRSAQDGKIVMVSIGMSNTMQVFCGRNTGTCVPWSFVGKAEADPAVDKKSLVLVNGARSGQTADAWVSPQSETYGLILDRQLTPRGLTEQQVQVAWVLLANRRPTVGLPNQAADAFRLEEQLGDVVRALKVRYPNLQQVFLSSRIYGGYAVDGLNPEPYAYESGFSVKWLIEAQIRQMNGGLPDPRAGNLNYRTVAPWIAWGPYTWADGLNPRSDGLTWQPADFERDGTHPSRNGEEKAGALLMDFFKNDSMTRCWFLGLSTCSPRPSLSLRDISPRGRA